MGFFSVVTVIAVGILIFVMLPLICTKNSEEIQATEKINEKEPVRYSAVEIENKDKTAERKFAEAGDFVSIYYLEYEIPENSVKADGRYGDKFPDYHFYVCENGKTVIESYYYSSKEMDDIEQAVSKLYSDIDYQVKQYRTENGIEGCLVEYAEESIDGHILHTTSYVFKHKNIICTINFLQNDKKNTKLIENVLDTLRYEDN